MTPMVAMAVLAMAVLTLPFALLTGHISPASPRISPASPPHRPRISPASPPHLPRTSQRFSAGDGGRLHQGDGGLRRRDGEEVLGGRGCGQLPSLRRRRRRARQEVLGRAAPVPEDAPLRWHPVRRYTYCSLLPAYCSLLTAYCLLLTAHCSLLTAHCSLLSTAPYYQLITTYPSLGTPTTSSPSTPRATRRSRSSCRYVRE